MCVWLNEKINTVRNILGFPTINGFKRNGIKVEESLQQLSHLRSIRETPQYSMGSIIKPKK